MWPIRPITIRHILAEPTLRISHSGLNRREGGMIKSRDLKRFFKSLIYRFLSCKILAKPAYLRSIDIIYS